MDNALSSGHSDAAVRILSAARIRHYKALRLKTDAVSVPITQPWERASLRPPRLTSSPVVSTIISNCAASLPIQPYTEQNSVNGSVDSISVLSKGEDGGGNSLVARKRDKLFRDVTILYLIAYEDEDKDIKETNENSHDLDLKFLHSLGVVS